MDFTVAVQALPKKRASLLFRVLILDQLEQAAQEGKHRAGLHSSASSTFVETGSQMPAQGSGVLWKQMLSPTHCCVI